MPETITVLEEEMSISFSFEDLIRYHGPGSPGGVAHAFKVLQRALPLLDAEGPAQRREITVRTAFGGPGARDGFEVVTRAVTGDRYVLDTSIARPDRGLALERFVFALAYRDKVVTLVVREGYVSEEFILLARKDDRTSAEQERLGSMKLEMADKVMSAAATEVYDVTEG